MKARTRQRLLTFGLGVPTASWSVAHPWVLNTPWWVDVPILAIGAGCLTLHLALYKHAQDNDFWPGADKPDWKSRYACVCGHPLGIHREHPWAPVCLVAVDECRCEGYVRRPRWHRRVALRVNAALART